MQNTFYVKPYTSTQLALTYKVTVPTFKKWIKPIETKLGVKSGNYFSAYQVKLIVKFLGFPFDLEED